MFHFRSYSEPKSVSTEEYNEFYRQTYKSGAGAKKSATVAAKKVANGSGPEGANGVYVCRRSPCDDAS